MNFQNITQRTISLLKENSAFSLVSLNALFLVLAFFVKDPLGLFVSTYEKAPAFFKMKEEEVLSVKLENDGPDKKSQEILRNNDSWNIRTGKGTFVADESKVGNLLKSLLGAKKFKVISSSKENSRSYGFQDENTRIEIFGKEGKSRGFLRLGSVTPRGSYTYVTFNDSPEIFLVEDNIKATTGRFEDDFFINKKLISGKIALDDIQEITVLSDGAFRYSLVKENKNWNLVKPSTGKASLNEVNSILAKLIDVKADELATDEEKFKMEKKTAFEIQISFKRLKSSPEIFQIKSIGKFKEDVFLQRSGDPTIYKIRYSSLSPILEKNADILLMQNK